MADKTQINLERIRACDAEWEESKHPRSENGQFTSGSGVKVSKATPAMKGGKFNNPKENIKKIGANALKEINKAGSTKQQFEASWKANEAIKKENDKRIAGAAALGKARPKIAAMRELAKAAQPDIKGMEAAIDKKKSELKTAIKKQLPVDQIKKIREDLDQMKFDYRAARFPRQYGSKAAQPADKPAKSDSAKQSVKSALNKHIKQIKSNFALNPDQAQNLTKDAQDMFKKAENAGALEKAAEFLKRKEKLESEMQTHDYSGDRYEWYNDLSKEDKSLVSASITGVLKMAIDRTPKPAAASGEKIPGTGHKKYGITRSDLLLT